MKAFAFRLLISSIMVGGAAWGTTGPPSIQDAVLHVTLRYTHPRTGKVHTLTTDSQQTNSVEAPHTAREWSVPAGVELRIEMSYTAGDHPASDGFSVDIWYDWNRFEYPEDTVDPDDVCLEENPRDCARFTRTLPMDSDFPGKDGRGVYNLAAWIDRFDTQSEAYEDNNFLGPIKIRAVRQAVARPVTIQRKKLRVAALPIKRMPASPGHRIFPFRLEPTRMRRSFSFAADPPVKLRIVIESRDKKARLEAVLRDETHDRVLGRARGTAPLKIEFMPGKDTGIQELSVTVNRREAGFTAGRVLVHDLK